MASGRDMMAPISLVENDNAQLSVNQEAIETLEKISHPVVVVAIVGLYRTGKSYLMNRLAGQNHGFPLGSTVQSKTKGIWMWCVPHPSKSDHTLVLLDTEGLGDVEKGDSKNDSWIFALAVLLCSTFIYNSMSTINNQALEHLHYVTELTQLIKAKSSPSPDGEEDCTEFVAFFPDFIWAVRDFTLELKLNGHPITEDQYLDNALKLAKGKNMNVQISNLCRECIREFFPTRKCFVFDRPTNDKKLLADIENASENQLNPKFQEKTKEFCSYIFTNAKTKTLREGVPVTGNWLGKLVVTYVDTINSGAVPCLENAVTSLAQLENSAAVQKAADHYSEKMTQRLSLPTDTFQELLEVHAACEKEAIAIFMEHSFKDENHEFQKNLVEIIKNKKEDFVLQNEETSVKYCQVKLDEISKTLMESISAGTFSVPGGYELYRKAKERFEQDYHQVPRKGVKANEVLQSFLQSQEALEKSILQADKALTDGEKTAAEMRARNEIAEKEQDLLKQKLQEQQQEMEAQQKSFQENIAQLTEKLEKERENLLREMNMMLEHKLKVQETLLNEGFREKSELMSEEINQLKNMIDDTKEEDTPWVTKALDKFGDELTSILSSPAKLLGQIVKGTNEVLQNFLQSQVAIEKSILQSDKALTDTAMAIAEEGARKEAAERECELLRQNQYEQQQQMETQDRSLRENIAQLRRKLERERENFEKEQERLLEHRLKVSIWAPQCSLKRRASGRGVCLTPPRRATPWSFWTLRVWGM